MHEDGDGRRGQREGRSMEGKEKIEKESGFSLKRSGELLDDFKPMRDTI